MEYGIYLESEIRGSKPKSGWCGYVIEAKNEKTTYTREGFAYLTEKNGNQAAIACLLYALERFTKPCTVTVYTDNTHVMSTIYNGWVQSWQRNNWCNCHGKEVKNKYLWQQVYERSIGFTMQTVSDRHHAYKNWIRKEIERRKKDGGVNVSETRAKKEA